MVNEVYLVQGTARILDSSVLNAYNQSIKSYNSERARKSLEIFNRDNGDLTGSSPLGAIELVNSGLLPEGAKLAMRGDLKNATCKDASFLRGHYTDFGLVLRTAGDSYKPNDLLAKRLALQLKQRGIKLSNGKLIPLDAVSLVENEESAYGLVVNFKEDVGAIRDLSDFKWDCTRDEGLACALFDEGQFWDSNFECLATSGSIGRMVIINCKR